MRRREPNDEMKCALIPAGNEDTASSRIRVYTLQRALTALGHAANLEYSADSDVLFIQKLVTWETYEFARQAKARGCTVLYDVDDLGETLWYYVPQRYYFEMIRLADAFTTDTERHKDLLLQKYGAKSVEIVPDTIDYYPSGPVRVTMREENVLRILWFGSSSNIALFERYASVLAAIPGVEVVVATNAFALAEYARKYPRVNFVPWSRSSFLSTLQSCDLSCLMHDGSAVDLAKSNNKMISSITWGVPAVVSRTPEYERTAREAGIETALFSNELELRSAVEHLRSPKARLAYLDRAQPEIWSRYGPGVVAKKFIETAVKYRVASAKGVSGQRSAKSLAEAALRQTYSGTKGCLLARKLRNRLEFEFWRFRLREVRIAWINSLFRRLVTRAKRFAKVLVRG